MQLKKTRTGRVMTRQVVAKACITFYARLGLGLQTTLGHTMFSLLYV